MVVCNKYHLILECQAMQGIQEKYCNLFTLDIITMHQLLWQDDMCSVMQFIKEGMAFVLS